MQTDAPFFTVIVPVIRGRYLAQALQSVLGQTFGDFELIVIDDASPDSIADIVAPFQKDLRVRFLRNPKNRGRVSPAIVWNQGLELARGQFTMVLGDDDFYGDNVLFELHKIHSRFPCSLVLRTRLCTVNAKGERIRLYDPLPEQVLWWEVMHGRIVGGTAQSICEHAFATDALRSEGGFWALPKAWGSDDAAVIGLAVRGGCAATSAAISYWRHDGRNITSFDLPEFGDAVVRICDWQLRLIESNPIPDATLKRELRHAIDLKRAEARRHYGSRFRMEKLKLRNGLKRLLDRLGLLDLVRRS